MYLCRKPDQLTVTEEWLERSGSLPLHLTLYFNSKNKKPTRIWYKDQEIMALFDLLRKHSRRWSRISVDSAQTKIMYMLFHDLNELPPSHSFHLRLQVYTSDNHNAASPDTPPLKVYPSRFESKAGVNITSVRLPFSWKNLTDLELCSWTAKDVLSVIGQAPELKRCVLRSISSESHWNAAQIPVIQPVVDEGLHELKLIGSTPDFFPNITLPSLQHLEYEPALSTYIPEPWDDLSAFLDRSKINPRSLETFALNYSSRKPWPESTRFQGLTEAVTHLILESWDIFNSLLLDVDFPRLRELQFNIFSRYLVLGTYYSNRTEPTLGPKTCETLFHYVEKYKITPRQFRPSLNAIVILFKINRGYMRLKKYTLSSLRRAQNEADPVKLEICSEKEEVNVLYYSRFLKPDDDDSFLRLEIPNSFYIIY